MTDKDKAWAEFDSLNNIRIQQYQSVIVDGLNDDTNSSTVAGSVAQDDVESSAMSSSDFQTLLRNSYIIIGLLAGVLVLLLALLVMMISRSRQERKYSPLMHTGGPNYSSGKGSVYENPYDS